jgi:hypothetical protein
MRHGSADDAADRQVTAHLSFLFDCSYQYQGLNKGISCILTYMTDQERCVRQILESENVRRTMNGYSPIDDERSVSDCSVLEIKSTENRDSKVRVSHDPIMMLDHELGSEEIAIEGFLFHITHDVIVRKVEVEIQRMMHIIHARVGFCPRVDFATKDPIGSNLRHHLMSQAFNSNIHARHQLIGNCTRHLRKWIFNRENRSRIDV